MVENKVVNGIINFLILFAMVVAILMFVWVFVGAYGIWSANIGIAATMNNKLFWYAILIAIIWGIMGFLQIFLNTIQDTLKRMGWKRRFSKRAQFEFDMETLCAVGGGILTGFLALFIMKGAGLGFFWKIVTFIASCAAGGVVTYIIFTRD